MSLTDTLKKIKQGSTYAGAVNYTAPTVNVAPRNEPANNLVNSLREIRQGNIRARDVNFDMSGAAKRDSLLYSRVNDFLTNSNKSYVKGNWNVKNWQKQYDTLMSDIDRYGETMEPSYKSALKAAMDETKKRMVPTQVSIQGYGRSVPTGYNEETGAPNRFRQEQATPFQLNQNLLTNAAPGQLSYANDRMNFNRAGVDQNGNVVPTSVPNTAMARLNQLAEQKIRNDSMLRNTAYYQAIGAPMDNYSNRDLQALQNMYGNLSAQQEAMQSRRAESKPFSPYEGVNMPGKDDLEDYSTKFDRIKKEHPAWSDDQVDDFIQNGEREDYTVAEQNPLADTEIFSRANNNIQTELGRRQFWSQYSPFFQEEDFKEKSKPAYNIPAEYIPDYRDEQARNEMSEDDLEGLFIASVNGNEQAREFLHYRSAANGEKTPYSYRYDRFGTDKEIYMNDDEVAMFNYLLNTQGKEAAMEFYDGLSDALDARKSAAVDEEWQQLTREAPFFANLATTALKPVTAAGSVVTQLYDLITTGNINANDPQYSYLQGVNTVRGTTGQMIREGTGSDFLADLYNTGMSVIDNVYGQALGAGISNVFGITGSAAKRLTEAVTLGIMSTDAAQTATLQNIRNGQDNTSAIINGFVAGGIEFLTEKIGLDNLFNSVWRGKEAWLSMVKQMLSEGGEEGLSDVMNWAWGAAYDKLTGQTTSEWTKEINAYILENGLAPSDRQKAFEHVFANKMSELGTDILMGTISGLPMSGVGTAMDNFVTNAEVRHVMPASISFSSADSSIPSNIRLADIDQVQGLIEEGLSHDPTTKAHKKAAKLQTMLDTGRVTDSQAIDLYKELVKADVTNEAYAAPELSSIDRSGETRPQTAFPMQGPSVNVPAATAQKFIPQELYLSALQSATNQDNTTTGETGIDVNEAETLIGEVFNEGLTGDMDADVNARAQKFIGPEYTEAIRQAGVQARDTNRRTAFGPTFNMPAQEMVQRDQLIEDVAAGYESAGRTSMGEVMRAFNPFKNHAVTDMSTADYVSEISAVYNAAAQNQEIPPTPHLTQQAAQAAINAAKMDRIYLDEGITSAEQAEMEAPEETNAAVRPAEYTPVEKTAEQRDTDYESILDYAGEVATADGQETFGDVVANNYYDDMDANAYTAGAQAILEQARQGVPLENVTLPAQAQKFISPQLKSELYNAVNTQEALNNASNTQEVTNGTEESGNVPVPGSSGRVNSTDTGIQSGEVAERTGQTETAGSTANVRTNVRTAFHPTGQTATAKSLGIDTGTDVNEVQIVELDDTEENNQLREIATAAHKKLVTFIGNNLSTTGQPARGVITGDTIYVRADHPTLTPLQIGKHEVMHGELRGDTNHKINTILNHLRALTDASFVDNKLIPAYKKRYAASGLSDLRVLEEMLCDIYGEMNEWNWKDLPGMEEMFNSFLSKGAQIVHETARNLNQTAEAVTEIRNNGPPAEENKFSMEAPIEGTDRLIAVHNMREDTVQGMLEIGGLAMPSVAITRADMGHSTYGDISAVYGKDSVAPSSQNRIFSGDAYTPIFPEVGIKVNYDATQQIRKRLDSLFQGEKWYHPGVSYGDDYAPGIALDAGNVSDALNRWGSFRDAYKNNDLMRLAFLKENGNNISMPYMDKKYANGWTADLFNEIADNFEYENYYDIPREKLMGEYREKINRLLHSWAVDKYNEKLADKLYPLDNPEELGLGDIDSLFRETKKYFHDQETGNTKRIDSAGLKNLLDAALGSDQIKSEYDKWLDKIGKDVIEKKGIRNNKDMFTPSGNRRSFEQLYYDYTLANIVKAMQSQAKQGNATWMTGSGNVRGAAARTYRDIEDVRSDIGRLRKMEYDEAKAAEIQAFDQHVQDVCRSMQKSTDRYDMFALSNIAEELADMIPKHKTVDSIYNYMKRELSGFYNVSREIAQDIYSLIQEAQSLPTSYFEGKMYRAVPITEALAYVVPNDMDAEIKQSLIDAGGNVIEYEAGNNEDRLEKINSIEGARFSTEAESAVLGYHAGDLGKAESLFNQSGGRSTGHFGTGTYFVGNRAKIEGYNSRKGQPAPVETVDFSQYNLFRPKNYRDAYALHEFMKYVDDRYGLHKGAKSVDEYNQLKEQLIDAVGEFADNGFNQTKDDIFDFFFEDNEESAKTRSDAAIIDDIVRLTDMTIGRATLTDIIEKHSNTRVDTDGDMLSVDDWQTQITPEEFLKSLPHDDAELITDWIETEANNWRARGLRMAESYEDWHDTFDNVAGILGISVDELERIIADASAEADKISYYASTTADSIATRVMKQLGYEGIDVRHIEEMDNTTYGSVIYDLKGKDLARKQEIGTARFSNDMKDNGTIVSKSQEDVAADLKKRVTQLEKKADYFKGQTKLSALTPGSVAWKNMKPLINEYGARKILRSVQDFYGSTADIKGMVPEIQRLVTLLATRPGSNTFDDVNHLILPIAKQLIENTQVIVEDDGSEILKDIRKTTIKVSPRTQADIADYNKWRMSHFGKMTLSTNKGTDVTKFYNELTERFGEAAFPSDINTATDQLLYIADFVDNYQPVTQNPYSYDMAALTQDAALTLYNEMLNADLFKPTYADKQNARIEKLQQESTERVQEVRRQARQQRDDQIQKIKDHAKEVAARRRARKEEQTARQKLIRLARRLNNMKTTKANRALIEELIGNLDTVAYSLTEGKAANLMELNAWYETQKETNPDFVAHADLVQKQLARLTQQHIADMTVSEILDLTKSLMTLENDIRTQNKLINSKMNEDALQAGIKAIRDIDNARGIDKGLRRTIDNLIVQGTLSPTRFMHRLTGYNDSDPLYQAVAGEDGLAGGQRKMLDYQYRAGKLFEEWLSDRKFTRWFTGTKAEILSYDIVTADGQQRTIQMTPAMRTTLYLAAKDKGWMQHMCGRDTMDGHIAGGGIVLPDIKSYRKGNISDAYDSGTVKVKITKSFLDKLAQDMSEQELKFAEAIHDYFNGMSKNEINAVSELLLGRSIAEVGDYLPISVDKNFLGAEYGAIKYDGTIEGMGNLKERQASKKPVIVRDITDILKQSIESTSKYVGLAIPIRNFNKIMGVTVGHTDENGVYQNFEGSVLESIANKWGKKAQTYIENMVSDLQTPNNSQEDLEKMFAKIRSKYAGAVLTLNASVALKQAASYPTAAAVLGWGPLLQAFQNPGHVDLDFIAKWTPLQWYRTKGFSTTELGDIQNQNNIFANMPKGLNWIQGMDLITTRKLWKAAEYYVRDNNPELYNKGAGERGQSDAFYRAVADIYNKTIEETQPNYTALQRPEYLRSKSGLVRTLMMFKTQPMQNFNVIYDAVGDFQAKRAQYRNNSDSAEAQQAYEESGKRLRRAVTSQIGQLITFAAMTMLWNMFRRKKEKYTDEEGNVSLEKIAESMGKDIGSGVFGMVPFGSEVWSFISSKVFGDKYYGFESVTDSAISDFLNAGSSTWELIGKIIEDDEPFNITTYKKKLKTVLSSASKIMGVPFDNLYNTVTAGYMRGRDMVDGLFNGNKNLADYWALSWTEDASKDKAEFFDILYNAHMDGKEGEYEEILQLMIDSGEYGDKPEETIADGLQDAFIKHTTHVKGEPDSDAKYRFYDYMYKHQEDEGYEKLHEDALFFGFSEDDIEKGIRNSLAAELIGVPSNEFNKDGLYGHLYSIFDTPEYKTKHDTLTANGWTEDEITDGLKKAYGVQLTGIDSSDYKNADLFTYLYDMKQTDSAGYTAATKEMKKIGFTDDNITDGMKKAYGMQVTGVTEEYSTAVLFDYLYDLKKNHVSNYNAELTKMKGVGFTDKNISDGMKDAYGRAVTGLGSDYTAEALYTTVYKNNRSSLSGKVSEMKGFGFSEQSIRDGLKQAYGSSATGIAYQTVKMDDVYDYIYGLYSNNSTKFTTEYQAMLNVGFTEKAIKDGIEARMKAAYGVDNVKKLPHRFAAPDHTLPSYWTYKNDEKDTGPLKEEGYANGSSWISNISYDNGELTVYEHGRPYTYHGVSEEAYENFKNEGYRGAALNKYIKGKYSYN